MRKARRWWLTCSSRERPSPSRSMPPRRSQVDFRPQTCRLGARKALGTTSQGSRDNVENCSKGRQVVGCGQFGLPSGALDPSLTSQTIVASSGRDGACRRWNACGKMSDLSNQAPPEPGRARCRFARCRGTVPRFSGATRSVFRHAATGTRTHLAKESCPWMGAVI